MATVNLNDHFAKLKSKYFQLRYWHLDMGWNLRRRDDAIYFGCQQFSLTFGHPVESRKLYACWSFQPAHLIKSQFLLKSITLRERKRLLDVRFRRLYRVPGPSAHLKTSTLESWDWWSRGIWNCLLDFPALCFNGCVLSFCGWQGKAWNFSSL